MSEHKSRSQKHQRIERYERRKAQKDEHELKLQQLEMRRLEQLEYAKLHPCKIIKAAEGVLCSIFTFLNVSEHCNLSRSCTKMEKISTWKQASPTQIDLEMMRRSPIVLLPVEVRNKIITRLMAFRPSQLIVPSHFYFDHQEEAPSKIKQMTSLRELTLRNNSSDSQDRPTVNIEWISNLTRLTKLTIPERSLLATTPLPASLTHLELLKTSNSGFSRFNSAHLLASPHLSTLPALQVLKLPNHYCELEVLKIGLVCPLLRELALGYFNVRDHVHVNFNNLHSCKYLEALTVGVDSNEVVIRWESLAAIPLLRRLTVSVFQPINPTNLFVGLSRVHQLTNLRLTPHPNRTGIDISSAIHELINPTLLPVVPLLSLAPITDSTESLPNLTSLLIFNEIILRNSESLRKFTTLKELMLPERHHYHYFLPELPRLHTLHVTKKQVDILEHYQDQLTTIVYKDAQGCVDRDTEKILTALLKMPKLVTLKLHPRCSVPQQKSLSSVSSPYYSSAVSVANYFRQHLPTTIKIEN